jgi:hypothetical protein
MSKINTRFDFLVLGTIICDGLVETGQHLEKY